MCIVAALVALVQTATAAEKKSLRDVDLNAVIAESQVSIGGNRAFNLVWYIPVEFWEVSIAQEKGISREEKKEMIDALKPYTIIGICRAEISPLGAFKFPDEKTVRDSFKVTFIDAADKSRPVGRVAKVNDEVDTILRIMKPMFQAALGKMGSNFHLVVCGDRNDTGGRIVSPYKKGTLQVELEPLGKIDGGRVQFQLPFDCLHVPRGCAKCERKAHISWTFCPWCGTKHEP